MTVTLDHIQRGRVAQTQTVNKYKILYLKKINVKYGRKMCKKKKRATN